MENKNETTKNTEEKPTDSKEQQDNMTSQSEKTSDKPKLENKEKVKQEDSNSKEKSDNTIESEEIKNEQENKTSNSAQGFDVNSKPEEKKKSKGIIKLIAFFVVLGTVGGTIYLNQSKQVTENSLTILVQNYSFLINSWNEQVQNRTDKKEWLLSRESNEKTIEQLNEWMKNFYISEVTDSVEYNKFLESNKQEDLIEFDTSMSEDKIREKLKMLSKDKTMSSIVQKVLMMNDMTFWNKNKESIK